MKMPKLPKEVRAAMPDWVFDIDQLRENAAENGTTVKRIFEAELRKVQSQMSRRRRSSLAIFL